MNAEEKAELLNRAAFFLIDNGGATALKIASALNTSTKVISQMMVRDPRFVGYYDDGETQMRYRLSGQSTGEAQPIPITLSAGTVIQPTASEHASLEAIMQALHAQMKARILGQADEALDRFVAKAIAKAMITVEQEAKSNLCDFLLFDGLLNTPAASNDAKVYVDPAAPQQKKEQNAFPAAKATAHPKAAPKPFEFTNPPGAPVETRDVVSKRTAHKSHGLAETLPEPTPKTTPSGRPPKIIIVGLHDNKQELIKREYRDKFTLCMFSPDRLRAMQACINAGDDVICMADYISHKHVDAVKAAGGKEAIIHGGMPALRDELTERHESICKAVEIAAGVFMG